MEQILQFQKYPAGCPCAMISTGHAYHAYDKSFIKKCLMVKKENRKKKHIAEIICLGILVSSFFYGYVQVYCHKSHK